MNGTIERKLTPFETESCMRLLDSLEIGGSISHHLVAGGEGGYFPCGTPAWMITPENEVTFKRGGNIPTDSTNPAVRAFLSNGFIQRFSSITELEAEIRWGSPWVSFDIRRIGERSYEMLNYKSVAPVARSPRERFESGDWFGH